MKPTALLLSTLLGLAAPVGEIHGQDILELARRRHGSADSGPSGYSARVNTTFRIGYTDDPLAPARSLLANQLVAAIEWRRADGLQIRMLGQRQQASFLNFARDADNVPASFEFDRPWFVATVPGDSLRILGGIGIPSRAAVHPFAAGAGRFYEFQIADTVTLDSPTRRIELVELVVTPTRGDESLVVGSIWIDASTGDIAAMCVRFVGKLTWANDSLPEGSRSANRALSVSATLRQQLWEERHWLPLDQEVELLIHIPLFSHIAVPVVVRNRFDGFAVTDTPIEWMSPDSLRKPPRKGGPDRSSLILANGASAPGAPPATDSAEAAPARARSLLIRVGRSGGGWEIVRPPDSTLSAYADWAPPLQAAAPQFDLASAAGVERRARQLPANVSGRGIFTMQYDRLPELVRFNRVEALGFGLAGRLDIPRRAYWSLGANLGFGVADTEFKGRIDLRYDPPAARADLAVYSELHVAGSELGNRARAYGDAYRAFLLGRDDADYYRASGISLLLGKRWRWLAGRLSAAWEAQRSVDKNTDVAIPGLWEDSIFPSNPPALAADFWRGELALIGYLGNRSGTTNRARVQLGVEVGSASGAHDYIQPRADVRGRFDFARMADVAVAVRGGWTAGTVAGQREFRLGGIDSVRGFTHGTQRGESVWTGQLQLSLAHRSITPLLFVDVGWAGRSGDWPGSDPLWSLGAGVSLFNGIVRTELVSPKLDDLWLEFYFAGAL